MTPHPQHPLLKRPSFLDTHLRNLLNCPSKKLFPGSRAPKKLPECNAAGFVQEGTDNAGVEGEGEGLGTVAAGCLERVGIDGNTAAGGGGRLVWRRTERR